MDSIWLQVVDLHRTRLERLSDPDVFCWFTALIQLLLREGHAVGPREALRKSLIDGGCDESTAIRIVAAIEAAVVIRDVPAEDDAEQVAPGPTRTTKTN